MKTEQLTIVKTTQQLKELVKYLEDKDFLAWDTETTGVDKDAKVIGISVAADTESAYYVILSYWDVAKQALVELETNKAILPLLNLLKSKRLIAHNGVFDCAMIENNYKVSLIDSLHTDTLILAHLLNENRSNGLKELGVSFFGEDAKAEQLAMKESVTKNGGKLTKDCYELYKADPDLIAKYGAKDALLTLKLFYILTEQLFEEGLDKFFYEDESMPLLRGPTYELNTVGLKVDTNELARLKAELEADCLETKAYIYEQVTPLVKDKYPGTNKTNHFNISSGTQLAWLLFDKLNNHFDTLTDGGRDLVKALHLKAPYSNKDKVDFISAVREQKGHQYSDGEYNPKTKKMGRPKKVKDYWTYLASDKAVLAKFASRYKWVEKLLHLSKQEKILNTYVIGIQDRLRYGIIHPSFLQHGTTSGRYSSKAPNFQNLPREDKRVKKCIVARPGKVFVGADYSQLEPRVFASMSQDETLMSCFAKGEDFYSVVGSPIFGVTGASMIKSDENSFANKYPKLRDKAKVIALATPYGRTASFTASQLGITRDEAQDLMERYFEAYGKVELMMLTSHEIVKKDGQVLNLFGRPRRIPEAKKIDQIYGQQTHSDLPYEARTLLNLSMNHRIQSTGASIVNRSAIRFSKICKELAITAPIVLQVHDQLVVECLEEDAVDVSTILKDAMENTVELPGVKLEAIPFVSKDLAGQK